jgi:hypothetical protein
MPADDQAMQAVTPDETERLDFFTQTAAAVSAVEHAHKVASLTTAGQVAAST